MVPQTTEIVKPCFGIITAANMLSILRKARLKDKEMRILML